MCDQSTVTRFSQERGFSLVEVLVSTFLLSLIALGITYSTVKSLTLFKRSVRHTLAAQLARDELERLSAIDPSTLTSANNYTDSSLVQSKIKFTRTLAVTVNADGSRSVAISVVGNNTLLGGRASITDTFPLRGRS